MKNFFKKFRFMCMIMYRVLFNKGTFVCYFFDQEDVVNLWNDEKLEATYHEISNMIPYSRMLLIKKLRFEYNDLVMELEYQNNKEKIDRAFASVQQIKAYDAQTSRN